MICVSRADSSLMSTRPFMADRRRRTPPAIRGSTYDDPEATALTACLSSFGENVANDVTVGAGIQAALHGLGVQVAGQDAYAKLRQRFAAARQALGEIVGVRFHVDEQQIRSQVRERCNRDVAIVAEHFDFIVRREQVAQRLCEKRLRLDDDDALGSGVYL